MSIRKHVIKMNKDKASNPLPLTPENIGAALFAVINKEKRMKYFTRKFYDMSSDGLRRKLYEASEKRNHYYEENVLKYALRYQLATFIASYETCYRHINFFESEPCVEDDSVLNDLIDLYEEEQINCLTTKSCFEMGGYIFIRTTETNLLDFDDNIDAIIREWNCLPPSEPIQMELITALATLQDFIDYVDREEMGIS